MTRSSLMPLLTFAGANKCQFRRAIRIAARRLRSPVWLRLIILQPAALVAQTAPPAGVVAEASALRDRGALADAARLLTIHLQQHPDDGDATRMLAQTLYWLKDIPGASARYEAAMRQHPEDATLRIDYARMLMETENDPQAIALLSSLLGNGRARARAASLLGTLKYWRGDLTAAQEYFEMALRSDSTEHAARRQLGEIYALAASWLRVSGDGRRDDQPLNSAAAIIEAGRFATPLVKLSARVAPARYWLGDTATRNILLGEAGVSVYAPAARLQTELAAGLANRSYGGTRWDWTGRAALLFRLPAHLSIGGQYEREPYLYTVASLTIPVTTRTLKALASINDPRGWLGEMALLRQQYPDANAVVTGYGWLLAPIVTGQAVRVQVGYAFSHQNADESRFVLALPSQPLVPGDPQFNLSGRYEPYYTPSAITSHSLVAAMSSQMTRTTLLHLSGSYAIRATQDAPSFVVVISPIAPARVQRKFTAVTFTPWNARASVSSSAGNGLGFEARGEYDKTAFYSAYTFSVGATYRFTGAALRRAERF